MPLVFFWGGWNLIMKPVSAVPGYVAIAGAFGAGAAWLAICAWQPSMLLAVMMFLIACALPMWMLELRRFPKATSASYVSFNQNWRRKLRLAGLAALMGLFFTSVTMFRVASPVSLSGLDEQLFVLLPLCVLWMGWFFVRRSSGRSLDSVESLGLAILHLILKSKKWSYRDRQSLLGWLVKAFYLPLMFSSAYLFLDGARFSLIDKHGWWGAFYVSYFLLFAIDTAFAAIGYCSTSRRIDSQIRSTEPTVLGWVAALICYPPLNLLILNRWLVYSDDYEWNQWLSGLPILSMLWGGAILVSTSLYVSATASFGLRFSNLTNRGIITSGPYAYFKHPSYIGKNVAWWLISVPFISNEGSLIALGHCMALLTINGIYVLRAKTEERHLSADPAYRAYSDWIAENGVFPTLCRKFFSVARCIVRIKMVH